jgi:hypothetical protein
MKRYIIKDKEIKEGNKNELKSLTKCNQQFNDSFI